MSKTPLYLVPFDFSEVSDSALRLALDLAEANSGRVTMLHITKKDADKKEARKKFEELMKELTPQEQALSETKVITGSLFEDMGKAAHLLSASLIVMGTHGAHGMQKVFGSNAVKMISNTSAPLLITQGKKTVEKIKNIVMPFSFAKESIQISTFAGSIAQKFNATIHLVGFHDKDEWLEGHTRTNQKIVRQLLTDNNIKHEIVNLSKKESYEKELMDYSASVDADLIAAAYFKEGIMPSPNSFIQIIIENELQIPLLTVNSEELSVTSGMSFMTV